MAMSSTGLMVATVVLSAGVAGATVYLTGAGTPHAGPSGDTVPTAEARLADLDARLEDQTRALAAIRGRLDEMAAARPAPGTNPVPPVGDGSGVAAVTGPARPADAAPGPEFEAPATTPALEAAVEAVLTKRREAEQAERRARIEERMQERLDRMAQEIGLNEDQKTLVAEVMRDTFVRTRQIIEDARSVDDSSAMQTAREEIARLREDGRTRLESALTTEQLKSVERVLNGGERVRSAGDAGRGAFGPPGGRPRGR